MKVVVFSTKRYDHDFLKPSGDYEFVYLKEEFKAQALKQVDGADGVCVFVNDQIDAEGIKGLKEHGIKFILLRCAGFNNVDLKAAKAAGIKVYRVPQYSPYAVAEFAVGLILALNRKIHRAYNRVRENNFSLQGLIGFDLHGKTVGIVGTGAIGAILAKILTAFGCKILCYDIVKNEKLLAEVKDVEYVDLDTIFKQSDIISLHAPLTKDTTHMVNAEAIEKMKKGVMIINTSRGGLIDTKAVIQGLKANKIGSIGMDVYENEGNMFFNDRSSEAMADDVFARITGFPNVIVTGHQAFLTSDALQNIAATTNQNIDDFVSGKDTNEMTKTVKD